MAAAATWTALPGLCCTRAFPTWWHGIAKARLHLIESPLGSFPLVPWGLFALNNRSIFRAFNFLVVPEPAVTKGEESTIRLCCLGGFHGHHRPLGLNSPLSSLAPWCECWRLWWRAFKPHYPSRVPYDSSVGHLLLSKENPDLCVFTGGKTSILGGWKAW